MCIRTKHEFAGLLVLGVIPHDLIRLVLEHVAVVQEGLACNTAPGVTRDMLLVMTLVQPRYQGHAAGDDTCTAPLPGTC